MARAFGKDLRRSIGRSLGRFIAIAVISGLGAGFFSGLMMTAPDMRLAADTYYDATYFSDMRVAGTLGLDDESMEILEKTDGIETVVPEKEVDTLCTINGVQYVVRVHTFDLQAARGSDTSDGLHAYSDDEGYINRPILVEGGWPSSSDECLLCADAVLETEVHVGDKVKVTLAADQDEVSDVLDHDEFTVTGFVRTPYYTSSASLGNTSLSTGKLSDYMLVGMDAFNADFPYTGAFVMASGSRDAFFTSDKYYSISDAASAALEASGKLVSDARYDKIVSDAQKELDDGWREYREERADAEKELSDAKKELDDAKTKLDDAEKKKLPDARRQLDDALRQINDGQRQLDDSAATIADSERKLADGRSEYEAGAAELSASKADAQKQLDEAQARIDAGRKELEAGLAKLPELRQGLQAVDATIADLGQKKAETEKTLAGLEANKSSVEKSMGDLRGQKAGLEAQIAQLKQLPQTPETAAQIAALEGAVGDIDAGIAELSANLSDINGYIDAAVKGLSDIEQGLATANATRTELSATIEQIEAGKAELDKGQAELDAQKANAAAQFEKAEAELATARATLDQGQTELDAGKAKYRQGVADLADARRQYADGVAEYEQGLAEYEDGKKKYEDGLKEYEDGRAEADEKFADAEKELADAKADIDAIEYPEWYVLDRSKNIGAENYISDADRIEQIARFFPFIFFLVAALVSLTTMTRMVDEERVLIGTYKALGYSNGKIISKYLLYAAISSGVGCLVGIIALTQFLPYFIMNAYAIMYQVPIAPTPINLPIALFSTGLAMAITLGATWWAAASSLREKPAQLMLPRAPKAGKRILLERIKPIWTHLSFSWKVTARNIFRYKRRFFMAIVGIAGCTALLLTGFGLSNSINDIIDKQYGSDAIFSYNLTISFEDDVTPAQRDAVLGNLSESPDVKGYSELHTDNMVAKSPEGEVYRLEATVVPEADGLDGFVKLRERVSREPLALEDGSVIITEKLAKQMGDVGKGDRIRLYDVDTVGNAVGSGYEFTVGGVTENYVLQHAYMTPATYEASTGKSPDITTLLVSTVDDNDKRQEISNSLLELDGVSTASFVDDAITYYRKALKSVDSVVIVLIVAAAALAFVVVYNLTNINIAERQREIATLKVLGFTPSEYVGYIFRETILLSVLGGLIGCFLGIFLEAFVVTTAEVDVVMFGREIHTWSFILSFVLTMVFTAVVMLAMKRKLDKISMVESLKSID